MSNAEFGFLASLMSDENLKTSVEGFIVDAQKMRQPAAISLPLLKVASTLLIALVAMPKVSSEIIILHQVLHFILQQLGSSTTFTQHSEPSSGSA